MTAPRKYLVRFRSPRYVANPWGFADQDGYDEGCMSVKAYCAKDAGEQVGIIHAAYGERTVQIVSVEPDA